MKFHEFGDKNKPHIMLIHGEGMRGGTICDKQKFCLTTIM